MQFLEAQVYSPAMQQLPPAQPGAKLKRCSLSVQWFAWPCWPPKAASTGCPLPAWCQQAAPLPILGCTRASAPFELREIDFAVTVGVVLAQQLLRVVLAGRQPQLV